VKICVFLAAETSLNPSAGAGAAVVGAAVGGEGKPVVVGAAGVKLTVSKITKINLQIFNFNSDNFTCCRIGNTSWVSRSCVALDQRCVVCNPSAIWARVASQRRRILS
jgi:hypothetical protein